MAFNTLVDGNTIEVSELNENFSNSKHFLGELKQICLSISGAETKANLQAKGWAVCDGTTPSTQGISDADITTTPNLQDKFIRMSNDETSGTTGGTTSHNHTGTTYTENEDATTMDGAGGYVATDNHTHNFTTDTENNLPPYYEVVFFMKVKIV